MGRPSSELAELFERFVLLRVTDMRGVDLARFRFDHDLTLALLVMDGEGRVLHRYGGRDERGPERWLNEASFEAFLRAGLDSFAERETLPAPLEQAPLRLEDVPSFAKRDKGACIHCHSVNTSLYEEARDAGELDRDWIWRYPSPLRIGLDLDPSDQRRVSSLRTGGAAAVAGVEVGDRLVRLAETPTATASDVMHALEQASPGATRLELEVERDSKRHVLTLDLGAGWKRTSPREFAWRPLKWALTPAPGFGGPRLGAEELAALELAPEAFAFRITYLVTWGDNQRYGRAAARAGLREGDVVTAVDGRNDFDSVEHFHAWWRLRVEPGQLVEVTILREGERREVSLEALP